MQVIAIALKDFVFLEADLNVQVTRRATIGARLTIASAANAHAVVNARRNFDLERFLLFEFALAAARRAGVGDDFAGAAAMRTGLLHTEKALSHLHSARALASAAGFGAGAFLGTRTATWVALIPAWNANLGIFASSSFFQIDFHGVAQIATAEHLSTASATTTPLLTKDVAKDIAKGFTKTAEAFSPTASAPHVGVNTSVTVLIVGRTFLCVRQHLVGLFDLFEFGLSVFGLVALMTVRVKLHCQFAIRFFNLFFRGVLGYTQYFVKVFFGHRFLLLLEQERRASDFPNGIR
jgi:hypothetical protein